MMKKNTIQGYLGGGYVQPRSYQTGGRVSQLMARIKAGRKSRDAQEAIADATASAQSAKDKILGYGKGFASLASLAAPLVANAILPGSGLLAGAIGKGLVAGGMGALGRFAGEKLGEELSDDVAKPEKGSYGMEQLDKISKYREGLRDDSLERSLATGAVAGVTAGVGDKIKTLRDAGSVAETGTATSGLGSESAKAPSLFGEKGLVPSDVGLQNPGFTLDAPNFSSYAGDSLNKRDVLENLGYLAGSQGDMTQGTQDYLSDYLLNPNRQQGGMTNRYQEGGLANLLSMLSGAKMRQKSYDEMVPQDMMGDALTSDAIILPALMEYLGGESSKRNIPIPSFPQDRKEVGLRDMEGNIMSFEEMQEDPENLPRYMQGYMGGGMTSQRKNYRGGGLISMMPFNRRIV